MEQSELVREVIRALEGLDIPYMVVGSFASIAYGEPRLTQDIDVVAEIERRHVPSLCAAFASPHYHISEDAVIEAISRKGQFNVIHFGSGTKVDFLIARKAPSAQKEFARRRRVRERRLMPSSFPRNAIRFA